ncbi:hypothetical protein [Spirosoma montaniterrae]|uniref:Uncharacterized protein n=1 Tax=Spirosoma montaniterrae TaxID=1178516 RepID=A0A1P9WTA6_9BACT|nr:hypothetical protein [Spirosoma montaniterrae]AQG78592.1 hypothetical protein AWR27_04085 [Spirosoma montaniterrae]
MEDLTTDQIIGIATGYRNMARALNEFQVRRWPEFTHEQQLDVNAYQNSLLNRAHDLQSLLVRPAFKYPLDIATDIVQATDTARNSLKIIRNLTVALNVGAIMVALASYVARANLRGIQTALRELRELVMLEEEK